MHPDTGLLGCEASCFTPEATTVELRVADAVFHLQEALARLESSVLLLESREEPHKQHARVLRLIKKQDREVRYLARVWADSEHFGLSSKLFAQVAAGVPITFSPFVPVHDILQDFIEKGEESEYTFGELELRMRVLLPNFMCATSQGHATLVMDTCTVLFATTVIEGRKTLGSQPGWFTGLAAKKIVADFQLEGHRPN